jgi:hypothetical protein
VKFLPPEHTPADRLDALHRVALASRELVRWGASDANFADLRRAVTDLDKIERYLGVLHEAEPAA